VFINKLAKRLPPIAWRDAKLREWREQNRRLREEVAQLGGSAARRPWSAHQGPAAAEIVRRSGLFDDAWYATQVSDPLPAGSELDHYLPTGRRGCGQRPGQLEHLGLALDVPGGGQRR